jgi:NADPH:quinone reductase-like Zn-dependent oxidoreductase
LVIRVVVAGVSRFDSTVRAGYAAPAFRVSFPWIPGFEVAGVVEQLGADCSRFRAGDRVWALLPRGGGYGQFTATPESCVRPMPASSLFEEAATLPLDGLAAWRALFAGDKPIDGTKTVIVRGASTGAGHLAVQLALGAGARVLVEAPVAHREFVERLGRVEWLDGADAVRRAADALGPDDRRIDASLTGPAREERWFDLSGGAGSEQDGVVRSSPRYDGMGTLATLVEQRRLRPHLFKILNIAKTSESHEDVESLSTCGKLALSF